VATRGVDKVHRVRKAVALTDEAVESFQSAVITVPALIFFIGDDTRQKLFDGFRLAGEVVRTKSGKAVKVSSIPPDGRRSAIEGTATVKERLDCCQRLHGTTSTTHCGSGATPGDGSPVPPAATGRDSTSRTKP